MSRYRITVVCMGNICRSPIAEAVLRAEFEQAGLGDRVDVDSAGTGGWHVGEDADPRAQAVLRHRGYALNHAARQFDPAWFTSRDLILALDESNLRALRRMAPSRDAADRLHLLRSYDPKADGGDLDVPDPYYGGHDGFEHVLTLIEAAAAGVVAHVADELAGQMNALPGLAALLPADPVRVTPVGGGCICSAYRVELADGRTVFVKERADAPEGFFDTEAAGLRWLAAAGPSAAPTPAVVSVHPRALVLDWVAAGAATAAAAEQFGRALAATHAAGAPSFGGPRDGWIGSAPLSNTRADTWAQFYARERVLPYLREAAQRRAISADDARTVEKVVATIDDLGGPAEPPARIHGDLWSGNVHWAADGRAWLVDPAAHGGHRETDLAMLALFGAPHLDRILAAYDEADPLADGWQQRVALHQLHPLLVHAVLFGGGYGARAGAHARKALSAG